MIEGSGDDGRTASGVMDEAFMPLDMFLRGPFLVVIHTIPPHATTRGISMAGTKTKVQDRKPRERGKRGVGIRRNA